MATRKKNNFLDVLPSQLQNALTESVHKLYTLSLENAKVAFDEIQQEAEIALGIENPIVDELAEKLSKDLKFYATFEDACWFLYRRLERLGKDHFHSLLNCVLLSGLGEIEENVQDFLDRVTRVANSEEDQIKLLLVDVLVAVRHHEKKRFQEAREAMIQLEEKLSNMSSTWSFDEMNDEDLYYLTLAYRRMAFFTRTQACNDNFRVHFSKALEINEKYRNDFGLSMELETFWIRAFKIRGQQADVKSNIENLLSMIKEAMEDLPGFEVKYGTKILREAYNDVSITCSFHEIRDLDIITVGEDLYTKLKEFYGEYHHEVLFIASQIAYNYENDEQVQESDRYLDIVKAGLDDFDESTKMIMQAKAKTLIHIWKVYRNRGELNKAEKYCRQELETNKKHGISQQYVANALRNLGFIVRDQDRWEEGLRYMKECLSLSREFSPSLVAYHEKVENEIRKF